MKKFILLLLACNCYGQYKIEYDYSNETSDSFGTAKTLYKCYLYTDNKRSKFIKDRVINGQLEQEYSHPDPELQEKFKAQNKANVSGDSIGYVVTKFMETDSVYTRTQSGLLIKEKSKKPDFKIVEEYKSINNYPCQKAVTTVYGKEFEVWFTTAIPINDGPWKLSGLPGLIIEVHSKDRFHNFYCTSIKKMSGVNYLYTSTPYRDVSTWDEITKSRIKGLENLFKYRKSKQPDSNLKMTINDLDLPLIEFK